MNTDAAKTYMQIPFEGFYNSDWEDVIDSALERVTSDLIESNPRFKSLDSEEARKALANIVHWGNLQEAIARAYAHNFMIHLQRELALPDASFGWEFDSLLRPQNYNYDTDRIFVKVTENVIELIYEQVDKTLLRDAVYRTFKGRSNFIPVYAHDAEVWLSEPVTMWDAEQTGVLLCAWMETLNKLKDEGEIWFTYDDALEIVQAAVAADLDASFELQVA